MPAQTSLLEQLDELFRMALKAGLYDAADFIYRELEQMSRRNEVRPRASHQW